MGVKTKKPGQPGHSEQLSPSGVEREGAGKQAQRAGRYPGQRGQTAEEPQGHRESTWWEGAGCWASEAGKARPPSPCSAPWAECHWRNLA